MTQIQTFADLIGALRRRLWLIVLVALIGSAIAVFMLSKRDHIYEATAVVQIESPRVVQAPGGTETTNTLVANAEQRIKLIEQRLMSRDSLLALIEKYNLFADAPAMSQAEKLLVLRRSTRISEVRSRPRTYGLPAIPTGLHITAQNKDPQLAADLANELTDFVMEENRLRRLNEAQETAAFLSAEEARVAQQIVDVEGRLASFKSTNAQAMPDILPILISQKAGLGEDLLAIERELIALDTSSRQRAGVANQQRNLLEEQRRLIAERTAEIDAALARAPTVEKGLNDLNRELRILQDRQTAITIRRADAEMTRAIESSQRSERFVTLERAIPPEQPISTSRKKIAVAAAVGSLLLGAMLALALEVMFPRIYTAEQVERTIGAAPIVSIPRLKRRVAPRKAIAHMIAALPAFLPFTGAG